MDEKFECLIQGILDHHFASQASFFEKNLVSRLRNNLLERQAAGKMHPAGIGKHVNYQKNLKVRGDVISWIDETNPDSAEQAFLQTVEAFCRYLNRTCYTGITGFEFHYALYETGSFYKRHLDQFRQDRGRKFSMVSYLNDDWSPADGGQLVLYLPDGEVEVTPEPGRVVFFKADEIEHEVKPARRDRLSIAGWLLSL
jgi:SM-20-related protein